MEQNGTCLQTYGTLKLSAHSLLDERGIMGGKNDFIRMRVDPELKKVIAEDAQHANRDEMDHVRHMLRLLYGLQEPINEADLLERVKKRKRNPVSKQPGPVKTLKQHRENPYER